MRSLSVRSRRACTYLNRILKSVSKGGATTALGRSAMLEGWIAEARIEVLLPDRHGHFVEPVRADLHLVAHTRKAVAVAQLGAKLLQPPLLRGPPQQRAVQRPPRLAGTGD